MQKMLKVYMNQAPAIAAAIGKLFPTSKRRLCQWHIAKNASSYLVGLISEPGFHRLFYKCMYDCDDEIEFEATWKEMMERYRFSDHAWLSSFYNIRQK